MALSAPIKTMTGDSAGDYSLEESDLVARAANPETGEAKPLISKQLLHDACVMYEANRRVGTVKTKGRGEVAGSTKKMYRQKGTGRARAGNRRTPVRVGGGHAFAKTPKDWSYRLPKKALRTAMRMALLSKFQDSEATVLDAFGLDAPKTRPVVEMLRAFGYEGKSTLLVVGPDSDVAYRSGRNIPGVRVVRHSDLNAYDLLRQKYLVITREAIDAVRSGRLSPNDGNAAGQTLPTDTQQAPAAAI